MTTLEAQLLAHGKRLDARKWSDHRDPHQITFLPCSLVQVTQNNTLVTCKITAEICTPPADQPSQGLFTLSVIEPSPTSLPSTLEYLFKEGKCLDLESLCLHPASRVWHIRVEVRVLQLEQPQSSAAECASVAVLAALLRFRRPEVRTKKGSERDSPANGNGVPLGLKQNVIAVQVAWGKAQGALLADPTGTEAEALDSAVVFGVNGQREMIGCWKSGGEGLHPEALLAMAHSAVVRGLQVIEAVKEAVKNEAVKGEVLNK